MLEAGGTLVDEGVHAFLLVLRGEQRVEQAALEHDAVGQRALEGTVHRFLGRHDGDLREAADDDGGAQGFVHELVEGHDTADQAGARSEEHTSELQSPCNLVCRLLLEKKKTSREKAACTFSRTASSSQ